MHPLAEFAPTEPFPWFSWQTWAVVFGVLSTWSTFWLAGVVGFLMPLHGVAQGFAGVAWIAAVVKARRGGL